MDKIKYISRNKKRFDTLPPEQVELRRLRKDFHKTLYHKMKSFDWVLTEKNIEAVKRIYLFKALGVETSRALSADKLREEIKILRRIGKDAFHNFLLKHLNNYNPKDFEKLSQKQRNKIIAIMVYSLKLSSERQLSYLEESIGRKDVIENISVNEANHFIRRLERWEAKILLGKRY